MVASRRVQQILLSEGRTAHRGVQPALLVIIPILGTSVTGLPPGRGYPSAPIHIRSGAWMPSRPSPVRITIATALTNWSRLRRNPLSAACRTGAAW